jgi:Kef-type K+ transport system membrane component KefB
MLVFSLIAEVSTPIHPLEHHTVLVFLLQLVVLLFVARSLGEWMRSLDVPPVVGELLAGVLLGPSVLGILFPGVQQALFPPSQTQSDVLGAEAWIGVLFLLIVTGLETDLNLILRKGKTALIVSLGGIIVPFISGYGHEHFCGAGYCQGVDGFTTDPPRYWPTDFGGRNDR